MARFAGVMDERTADFENSTFAYCVDAFSISIGALIGTSPVTAFIESATVRNHLNSPINRAYTRRLGYL
jgi:AGZA family xanthine/uracil permease-like MFS transporter